MACRGRGGCGAVACVWTLSGGIAAVEPDSAVADLSGDHAGNRRDRGAAVDMDIGFRVAADRRLIPLRVVPHASHQPDHHRTTRPLLPTTRMAIARRCLRQIA